MSKYFNDVVMELDDGCRNDFDGWFPDTVEKYNFFIGFYITPRAELQYIDSENEFIDYDEYSDMFKNDGLINLAGELFTTLRSVKKCSTQFFFKNCSNPKNDWKQIRPEIQELGESPDGKKTCKKYQEFFLGLDVSKKFSWMEIMQLVKNTGKFLNRMHKEFTDNEKLITWFIKYVYEPSDASFLVSYVNYGNLKKVRSDDNKSEHEQFGEIVMNICNGLDIATDYKRIFHATDEEFFAHFISTAMKKYMNVSKDLLKIVENRTRVVREVPEDIFSVVPYNLIGKFGCVRRKLNTDREDTLNIDAYAVLDLTDIRKTFSKVSEKATKWMLMFCYPDETAFFLLMVPNKSLIEQSDENLYYFFYKGDAGNRFDTYRLYELLAKMFLLTEEHIGFIYSKDASNVSSRLKRIILSIFKKEKESMFND